jgi:hypothetical protein
MENATARMVRNQDSIRHHVRRKVRHSVMVNQAQHTKFRILPRRPPTRSPNIFFFSTLRGRTQSSPSRFGSMITRSIRAIGIPPPSGPPISCACGGLRYPLSRSAIAADTFTESGFPSLISATSLLMASAIPGNRSLRFMQVSLFEIS